MAKSDSCLRVDTRAYMALTPPEVVGGGGAVTPTLDMSYSLCPLPPGRRNFISPSSAHFCSVRRWTPNAASATPGFTYLGGTESMHGPAVRGSSTLRLKYSKPDN